MPTDLDLINASLTAAVRHAPAGSSKGGQFISSGGAKSTGSVTTKSGKQRDGSQMAGGKSGMVSYPAHTAAGPVNKGDRVSVNIGGPTSPRHVTATVVSHRPNTGFGAKAGTHMVKVKFDHPVPGKSTREVHGDFISKKHEAHTPAGASSHGAGGSSGSPGRHTKEKVEPKSKKKRST